MTKIEELLVKKGLYDYIEIAVEDLGELERLLAGRSYNGYNIDCFCIQCGEMRVFESVDKEIHEEKGFITYNIFDDPSKTGRKPKNEEIFKSYLNKRYCLSFQCTREHNHSILFDLLVTNDRIIKIGQYPSFADVSIGNIKKYKSVLGDQYREYSKSLGLFSHGVGIGSFVYLRRIIERLVFQNYDKHSIDIGISNTGFEALRFIEKIDALSAYLPTILVENKNVYGIVSKGVHELSEEECLDMYPYIQAGIELMLDELLEEKERAEKEKLFSGFVAKKTGEYRKAD